MCRVYTRAFAVSLFSLINNTLIHSRLDFRRENVSKVVYVAALCLLEGFYKSVKNYFSLSPPPHTPNRFHYLFCFHPVGAPQPF